MGKELPGVAGILGGYEIHFLEDSQRAQGDILKVTNRRSNYIQRPHHIPPCPEGREQFAASSIRVLLSALRAYSLELKAKGLKFWLWTLDPFTLNCLLPPACRAYSLELKAKGLKFWLWTLNCVLLTASCPLVPALNALRKAHISYTLFSAWLSALDS